MRDHEQRWKVLGFALHCSALQARLLDLKRKQGYDKTPAGDQLRLFQLTTEDRADFTKFAKNLLWLITDHAPSSPTYWQGLGEFQYTEWEFRKFFDPFQRDKTVAVLALLDRIGSGEELNEDEMRQAMEFLHMLNCHALCDLDAMRRGCF